MYGLYQKSPIVGPIVGLAISGAMWLMESVLVWLWVDSHSPYQKSLRERVKEAKHEIKEIKAIQRIEWMKWEAQKPDLALIREAREAEEERKRVVGDRLPEFFTRETEQTPELIAEPIVHESEPKPAEIVPMRKIGFHMEPPKATPRFQPNLEAREQAIKTAKALKEELGRLPTKRELMEKGLTDHYSRIAISALKEQ
jgi:hypothetical protein